jgi:hypothetical protein
MASLDLLACAFIVLGDVLEIAALYSLKTEDTTAFERYFKLLKPFYVDVTQYAAVRDSL